MSLEGKTFGGGFGKPWVGGLFSKVRGLEGIRIARDSIEVRGEKAEM